MTCSAKVVMNSQQASAASGVKSTENHIITLNLIPGAGRDSASEGSQPGPGYYGPASELAGEIVTRRGPAADTHG